MNEKKDTQCNQNSHDKIYQEVIHIDDAEVVAQFMDKYRQDQEEALAYLSHWDYGETSGELLTYSQIMDGLANVHYVANDMYLALWQAGIDSINLYRVVGHENSDDKEVMLRLSDGERFIVSEGLIALMHNIHTLKTVLYDEEVYKALDAYIEKVKKLNNKICLEMDNR